MIRIEYKVVERPDGKFQVYTRKAWHDGVFTWGFVPITPWFVVRITKEGPRGLCTFDPGVFDSEGEAYEAAHAVWWEKEQRKILKAKAKQAARPKIVKEGRF